MNNTYSNRSHTKSLKIQYYYQQQVQIQVGYTSSAKILKFTIPEMSLLGHSKILFTLPTNY